MFMWFNENLANIIICMVLIAVVALIITGMFKNKRKGKSSCGSGCAGCPMSGSCHHGK